ncbi:MAG: methyltransferase domain-containing protein [Candidatus Rokubacteria bacterium]|nr:methyltransferase domain-containing protein [Candidatus Rokubacteria bacterium]
MNRRWIPHLRSPDDGAPLALAMVERAQGDEIESGELLSTGSGRRFPIRAHIPRFVEDGGYAASFGVQWNRYRAVQIDRLNGTTISRDYLLASSGWTPDELGGARVLEVGCGAGRFTQVLLDAGAEVYAFDATEAVDACWATNGPHERLRLVQADLYAPPFPRGFFDRILCYGVLQHTRDVHGAFLALVPFLRPGGSIAIDVYRKRWWLYRWTAKYWYRPLTKRLPTSLLMRIVEWYVPRWLPVDIWCQRVPLLRWIVPAIVPCWNYTGVLPLDREQLTQWAILNTFDALSAWYDSPQTPAAVRSWLAEAGLGDVQVRLGGNGILAAGRRPSEEPGRPGLTRAGEIAPKPRAATAAG